MRKMFLLSVLVLIFLFVVGCIEDMDEEELEAEFVGLSDEGRDAVVEGEESNIAGQGGRIPAGEENKITILSKAWQEKSKDKEEEPGEISTISYTPRRCSVDASTLTYTSAFSRRQHTISKEYCSGNAIRERYCRQPNQFGYNTRFIADCRDVDCQGGACMMYDLALGGRNEVVRSGEIGDNVSWVVEHEGGMVLRRNARNELSFWDSRGHWGSGNTRVWAVTIWEIGTRVRTSNIVEIPEGSPIPMPEGYQATHGRDQESGNHVSYRLGLNFEQGETCEVVRSFGEYPEMLSWVVEMNGLIYLSRNALGERRFDCASGGTPGTTYRIWLEGGGNEGRMSNIIEYTIR